LRHGKKKCILEENQILATMHCGERQTCTFVVISVLTFTAGSQIVSIVRRNLVLKLYVKTVVYSSESMAVPDFSLKISSAFHISA
jgi:tRNA A37 threonylcarbamoyladenosine dehydratase